MTDQLPENTHSEETTHDANSDTTHTETHTEATTETNNNGDPRVQQMNLRDQLSRSYMDYAMSVIVSRALPDVRDGMKPVHRRVLYGMYAGGYRPEKAYSKSARIVGDVMGNYHPHGDSAIYETMVRMVQPWSLRHPLVDGSGNFGSQGNDGAAAPRYTEARMAPLAMEMLRDIDEEAVSFKPNYDGRTQEPTVLPSRFPNLIVNGSSGIAVGMATNIPPANLIEVNEVVQWYLKNSDCTEEELLSKVFEHMQGPDFPTGCIIAGTSGIRDAYTTGRGSIRMRARVEMEETKTGRTKLVITSIPYQVNKDVLLLKIKELADDGKVTGISDLNDESSSRAGMRLVITLQRGAVAKVVLNNLYKHTQLQATFGANVVAIVNGEPKTLPMPRMISLWVQHQITVIEARTQHRLAKAQARQHILNGILAALDQLDEVIRVIRASTTIESSREALRNLLGIDDIQANAILEMQLRRLAALERDKIVGEHEELTRKIGEYNEILSSPEKVREIIGEELAVIVAKHGTPRMCEVSQFNGDVDNEDLIPREEIIVTITKAGYAKRTPATAYRLQSRGGTGGKGTKLRSDDIVEHFLVTSTHNTLLFFTNKGKVYRVKGYELAEGGKDARGSHIANILGFEENETIARILTIASFDEAQNLVLATAHGLVKKTPLLDYNTRITAGLRAVNLRDGDELVAASVCNDTDVVTLVSQQGQATRFVADQTNLRATGRNTSGVTGMRFREDDRLLSMVVTAADENVDLLLATTGGYGKRTSISEYPIKRRGGKGVIAMKTDEDRGNIVSAGIVDDNTQIFALTDKGVIIRTTTEEIRPTSRNTMGVKIMKLRNGDQVNSVVLSTVEEETPAAETVSEPVSE